MLLYSSIPIFEDANAANVYRVVTKLASYRVVVTRTEVGVFGPGIEEHYDIGNTFEGNEDTISDKLSEEAKALMAVLILEEGE